MLISANAICVRKAGTFAKRFCKVNETKVKDELTAETKGQRERAGRMSQTNRDWFVKRE